MGTDIITEIEKLKCLDIKSNFSEVARRLNFDFNNEISQAINEKPINRLEKEKSI